MFLLFLSSASSRCRAAFSSRSFRNKASRLWHLLHSVMLHTNICLRCLFLFPFMCNIHFSIGDRSTPSRSWFRTYSSLITNSLLLLLPLNVFNTIKCEGHKLSKKYIFQDHVNSLFDGTQQIICVYACPILLDNIFFQPALEGNGIKICNQAMFS